MKISSDAIKAVLTKLIQSRALDVALSDISKAEATMLESARLPMNQQVADFGMEGKSVEVPNKDILAINKDPMHASGAGAELAMRQYSVTAPQVAATAADGALNRDLGSMMGYLRAAVKGLEAIKSDLDALKESNILLLKKAEKDAEDEEEEDEEDEAEEADEHGETEDGDVIEIVNELEDESDSDSEDEDEDEDEAEKAVEDDAEAKSDHDARMKAAKNHFEAAKKLVGRARHHRRHKKMDEAKRARKGVVKALVKAMRYAEPSKDSEVPNRAKEARSIITAVKTFAMTKGYDSDPLYKASLKKRSKKEGESYGADSPRDGKSEPVFPRKKPYMANSENSDSAMKGDLPSLTMPELFAKLAPKAPRPGAAVAKSNLIVEARDRIEKAYQDNKISGSDFEVGRNLIQKIGVAMSAGGLSMSDMQKIVESAPERVRSIVLGGEV
jgi:hypothetical protein